MADFNPDAYLQSKTANSFDPDSYLKSKSPQGGGSSYAALQGFGQAATSGYLPELQAAAGGLLPNPSANVDKQLQDKGFQIQQQPDTFSSRLASNRAEQANLAKESPGSYYGGAVGGAIATAPMYGKALSAIPKLAPQAGMGLAGKLGQAAAGGAIQGAIQNPEQQGGEVSLNAPERLSNAIGGAVLGAGVQGAASALKAGADAVANAGKSLTQFAQMKAFKSTGAMLKDFRKAASFNRVNDIGQEMIDRGYVKPGSTFDDVAEKAAADKNKIGQAIGDIYDKASNTTKNPTFLNALSADKKMRVLSTEFNPKYDADLLENQFKNELKGKPGGTQALGKVQQILGELRDNGPNANLNQMQEFKEGIDDMLKWNKPLNDEPLSIQYITKIRNYLKDRIQDRIGALDDALGNNALQSLKDANKAYGNLSEIARIAKDRMLRENTNRMFGLTDTIAGVGGAVGGAILGEKEGHPLEGALLGAGLGAANKLGRTYGNPLLTTGASKLGSAINRIPPQIPQAISNAGSALTNNPATAGATAQRLRGLLK